MMRRNPYMMFMLGVLLTSLPAFASYAQQMGHSRSVVTDTRIRTLVYNENEVYRLVSHYGFQSNIEFGEKEEIDTISLGDQVAWQVIPSGRHLFIRAQAFNTRTNMTIITNERIYQFDLISPARNSMQQELSYVIRFYYPEDNWDGAMHAAPNAAHNGAPMMAPGDSMELPSMPAPPPPMAPPPPAPMAPPPSMEAPMAGPMDFPSIPATQRQQYNQNYTLSGPEHIAPTKIFDDGQSTYFQFRPAAPAPQILVVTPDGREMPVPQNAQSGMIVVPTVQSRFSLRAPDAVVCVFNESM